MSEREKTLMKACLALLAIVVTFLILRRFGSGGSSVDYTVEGNTIQGGNTTQGGSTTIGGAGGSNSYFNSQNDVNVNTIGINELSQKYIPMFGLVGMTAVGNVVINQQAPAATPRVQAQAPLQQVFTAATKQPAGGFYMHQAVMSDAQLKLGLGGNAGTAIKSERLYKQILWSR